MLVLVSITEEAVEFYKSTENLEGNPIRKCITDFHVGDILYFLVVLGNLRSLPDNYVTLIVRDKFSKGDVDLNLYFKCSDWSAQ